MESTRYTVAHALIRPVLRGGEGARSARRALDAFDRAGAAPGSLPLYGPAQWAARDRHEPARRAAAGARGGGGRTAGGGAAADRDDPLQPHQQGPGTSVRDLRVGALGRQ